MATLTSDKITQADMRAALMQARRLLGGTSDAFVRSARAEFDGVRNYRDHIADAAEDLRAVLERQPWTDKWALRNPRNDAKELVAHAEAVNALACLMCNGVQRREADGRYFGSWTEADETTEETTRRDIVRTMNLILAPYGAKIAGSYGDPRGACTHIQFADNSSNRGARETVWGI